MENAEILSDNDEPIERTDQLSHQNGSSNESNTREQRQLSSDPARWSLRNVIGGLCLSISFSWGYYQRLVADNPIGFGHYGSGLVDWNSRREQVKDAFVTSWDAYAKHAWGEWLTS